MSKKDKETIENPSEASYNEGKEKAGGETKTAKANQEFARLLKNVDGAAQYDACVKRLLGSKDILSHFLVHCVKDFEGMNPKEAELFIEAPRIGDPLLDPGLTNTGRRGNRIVGMNTEDAEVNEGLIRFDIVFRVRLPGGGRIEIIVNVEAQMRMPQGYPILSRAIFYIARLISSQKDRDFVGTHYEDIKRVYSIWVCMNMSENSMTSVSLDKSDIINAFPLEGNDLGLLNIILIGLTSESCEREEGCELHRLLSTLLSMDMPPKEKLEILEGEYGIARSEQREEEMNDMCNLSQGILEVGIERGWEKGREEGIEQGLSRGREEGIEQGLLRGRKEGREEGESKATTLFHILLTADRIEDLRRASEDDDYRKELYAEYGIE